MNKHHISNVLRLALSAYQDWKHPNKYFDTPKWRQSAKNRYHSLIKFYRELRRKYC